MIWPERQLRICLTAALATVSGVMMPAPASLRLVLNGAAMAVSMNVGWMMENLIAGAFQTARVSKERPSWRASTEALVLE
jgi:hypothetical protein